MLYMHAKHRDMLEPSTAISVGALAFSVFPFSGCAAGERAGAASIGSTYALASIPICAVGALDSCCFVGSAAYSRILTAWASALTASASSYAMLLSLSIRII